MGCGVYFYSYSNAFVTTTSRLLSSYILPFFGGLVLHLLHLAVSLFALSPSSSVLRRLGGMMVAVMWWLLVIACYCLSCCLWRRRVLAVVLVPVANNKLEWCCCWDVATMPHNIFFLDS